MNMGSHCMLHVQVAQGKLRADLDERNADVSMLQEELLKMKV